MKLAFLNSIKVIVIFFLCLNDIQASNATRLAEFAGGIHGNAIWHGREINNYLEEKCGGDEKCTAQVLQQLHADQQAVAFSKWKAGLITNYQKYNNLYTFSAWLPGARLKEGVFIGNNQGMVFEVDNWLERHKPFHNTRRNQIDTRYGCQFPPVIIISKERQRLVYQYPIVGMAGKITGHAKVAFDFNNAGDFLKAHFIF